jgi:hypothetical protein
MMKKIIGGKIWTAAGFLLIALILIGLAINGFHYYLGEIGDSKYTEISSGSYSVDGGEWKDMESGAPIKEKFHRIILRWKPVLYSMIDLRSLNIQSKNVWFKLSTADGDLLLDHSHQRRIDDLSGFIELSRQFREAQEADGEPVDQDLGAFDSEELYLIDTPGYYVGGILTEEILATKSGTYEININDMERFKDLELVLEVENPYENMPMYFSDCISVSIGGENSFYADFYYHALPVVLLFILVCFFGIFLFPIAGFILGKIDYRYLTFGALCFIWGIFMISQKVSGYLNLVIKDSTVCMLIVVLIQYLMITAILFYMKANLKRNMHRMIGNIIATVFLLMVVTGLILHKSHVMDIYAFSFILNIAAMIVMIAMGIVLFKESKEEKKIGEILIAWAPLILSILLDGLNKIFYFTDIHFYYFGLSITMFYQIFRIIIDLRTQHREAIRYEKMQKELYEAQVGVMVSQIQPHFMYNALSSIAMMCTLDGKKAKEATITFAKYLRGNMDSLKQKKPVPFSQELEHLKKYLYIEKMRFEEALNIVYDIETEDFVLPQLSIQPLVENAVKHGVGMKEDGGTVTIATRETDEDFRVIISDDGVGFDTNAPKAEDGRSHVGMENTKRRIADLCGGSVVIESTPGEGTVATVILPKSGQPTE